MIDKDFYWSAGYLASPRRSTNIEVEMHPKRQGRFITDYAKWTHNHRLPSLTNVAPYYVYKEDANKYGLQMRVYFNSDSNIPDCLNDLLEPKQTLSRHGYDNWNRRISRTHYVTRLLEVGFVLGTIQKIERIKGFIPSEFIDYFEAGFNL